MSAIAAETTPSWKRVKRQSTLLLLFAGALALSGIAGLGTGAYPIPLSDILGVFVSDDAESERRSLVLLEIRAPRILFGMLVGAALGISGAALQGLFRNPLADPTLIGVSMGAAFGAVTVLVLGATVLPAVLAGLQDAAVPVAAFLSAGVVTVAILAVGSRGGRMDVALMLLAGIALNAIAAAGIGIMTYLADDQALRDLTFWMMGSLAVTGWGTIGVSAAMIVPAVVWLAFQGGALNRYLLGEAEAGHLGVDVGRLKGWVVLCVAVSVGAAVAVAGAIGFVGLVVPHLARLMGGPDNRYVLPASALLGGVMTVCADSVARVVLAPAEVPVGLILSAVGGPFFLWFLLTRYRRGG